MTSDAGTGFTMAGGRRSDLCGWGETMRKFSLAVAAALILLFGAAGRSEAQVRRVEMRIAGYLCGN